MQRAAVLKHFLVILGLGLLVLAAPSPVEAQDCQYTSFKLDLGNVELVEPLPDYDECFYFPKLLGTLNGDLTSCLVFGDIRASDDVWGDGSYDYYLIPFDDFVTTPDGDLFLSERLVYLGFGLAHGLAEVTDGTGAFDGATGVLGIAVKWPNRPDLVTYDGYICTPEE